MLGWLKRIGSIADQATAGPATVPPVNDATRSDPIADAVAAGDLDRLVRLVDGLCSAREWNEVVRLRDRCRDALERGLQLWPAAEFAEYRLALEAPAAYAGPVVVEGAGRFALGPLWEVAASTHGWSELAPHIPGGPARAMAAHERVVRGEDLSADDTVDHRVLDLPGALESWEPAYPVAAYRADTADFPAPPLLRTRPVTLPPPGPDIDDEESTEALFDLVRVWLEQSNGSCAVAAVEGSAEAALSAVADGDVLAAELSAAEALAWMAWAGASGGAYGRRRGTPAGRFAAWWAAACMAGLDWPPDPALLGSSVAGLRWVFWEPRGAVEGWRLHLAVEHPREGIAWAISAEDRRRDAEEEL
jgi:hypothetical protein